MSWNDPQLIDLTSEITLMHDLDVSVTQVETVRFPCKLDAANMNLSETKGDNIVNNIEKIEVDNPSSGPCKITINHKGTLAENQSFSLLVSVESEAPTLSTNAYLALTKQQLLLCHGSLEKLLTITHSDPSIAVNGFEIYELSGRLIGSKTLEQAKLSFAFSTNKLFSCIYIIKAHEKGVTKYEKIVFN